MSMKLVIWVLHSENMMASSSVPRRTRQKADKREQLVPESYNILEISHKQGQCYHKVGHTLSLSEVG